MKIQVDFSELIRLGELMMPQGTDFSLFISGVFEPLDIELGSGKDIDISELDEGSHLLSYRGRQVLLYIKDHTGKMDAALADPERGNRFHISHCKTLEDMKMKNRFQRYVATNRLDGMFSIEEAGRWGNPSREADVSLRVCKFCLEKLNYKNSADYKERQKVFRIFSLTEFFSHYSTCFTYMPKGLSDSGSVGYTQDWPAISKRTREQAGYRCSQCTIDLSSHKHLCDVHHINGVKSDNSSLNLRVLCKDCHRKQPFHSGVYLSAKDMDVIRQLRSSLNLFAGADWDEVFALTDTSIHGDISFMRKRGLPPPVPGYDVLNERHEVQATLEAAWPDKRIAVHVASIEIPGWRIYPVGGMIETV